MPSKKLTLSVLVFTLMMQGCAFFGIDLTDDRTITVIKSPYLVSLSGDITEHDQKFVNHTLHFLSTQPFQNYEFKAVTVTVTGSESDITRNISKSNTVMEDPQSVTD